MDTLGIADGFAGIGFGLSSESLKNEQLIDNVKVIVSIISTIVFSP